MLAALKV